VGVILYDTLKLPYRNMTRGGQRSVDKQTLTELRGRHPVVDGILEWREIDKIARDFLTTLPAFAYENGRVHLHAVLPEGARLISVVHDEFIVECRQEQAEDVRLLMVETMQKAPEGFVAPMVVEAKVAANWGDAK
jgi:DNA polymerase I